MQILMSQLLEHQSLLKKSALRIVLLNEDERDTHNKEPRRWMRKEKNTTMTCDVHEDHKYIS